MEIKERSRVKVSSTRFPEDVVVEILSRLPVKSLLRFKCVSKEWKTIIESTYFTAIHLQRSDRDLSLLFKHPTSSDIDYSIPLLLNESTLSSLDLPFLKPRMFRLLPVGSSNGLVCLSLFDVGVQKIVVWNPATKQFRYHLLPKTEHYHRFLGFAFFHDIRDYKVVTILQNGTGNTFSFRAKVFTKSTDSWREVETGSSLQRATYVHYDITLNGVLYMILWEKGRYLVASFNLRDEVFHVMPLPERINRISALFSWKNSLALVAGEKDELRELWMMTEEPSAGTTQMSWVKQIIFKPSLLPSYNGILEG